jgi:hypothetical protein
MNKHLIRSEIQQFPKGVDWSCEMVLISPTSKRLSELKREFCTSLNDICERGSHKLYISETLVPRTKASDCYRLEMNMVGITNE